MNNFEKEIINYIGKNNFRKLQKFHIGIAGCGGLGSNCAMNLVRSGSNRLTLVDLDKVELKNLNRQFYFQNQVDMYKVEALKINLKKINPDVNIVTFAKEITENNILGIFKDCDIIVEAFDRAQNKTMLVKSFMNQNQLVVCASGLAGFGDSDKIKIHYLKKNLIMIGDLTSQTSNELPPLSAKVNIAAAKQADTILEYILEN